MPTSRARTSSPRPDWIVIDDPIYAATEADRAKTFMWWQEQVATMQERFSGPPVIIMARLHEADIPGPPIDFPPGTFEDLTIPPEQG